MSVEVGDDFVVSGHEVTLDCAEAVKERGVALIEAAAAKAETAVTVDLSGLERANSVTIAVMCVWFRTAAAQNLSIVFVNLSGDLRNIIEVSGLSDTLLKE